MKNEEFTKKRVQKTKIIPTTQCEDDFYYYLYTLGLSIYHAADSMLPSPPLFLFLQTKGRKNGMIVLHRENITQLFLGKHTERYAFQRFSVSVGICDFKKPYFNI